MKYSMHLQRTPFNEMKSGKKTIEIRLNDDKRKNLQKGDEICFSLNKEESIDVEVVDVFHFSSFVQLCASSLRDKCGMIHLTNEEFEAQMAKYYSKEDVEKYGVLAIEVKLLTK